MTSTADYVNDAMQSREDDLAALFDRIDEGSDDAREELDEFGLSAEVERHLVVTISTGGPHEEIDAVIDSDGTVLRATFGAYWGSDRRETRLSEGGALWRYVAELAELHATE